MIKEFNIDVPLDLSGITLGQYQEWNKIVKRFEESENKDDNYLKVKMLQTFCNLPIEDTYKIPLNNFDSIVSHLAQLFQQECDLVRRWDMIFGDENVEYGFIPNLDKMSFGEFIDLDTYVNDWDKMNRAMAVLYRPVLMDLRGTYNIQEYKGSDAYAEVMKDMPLNIALGAINFLLRLGNKLVLHTTDYSLERLEKETKKLSKQTSEENGDGIKAFTLSLKVMQLKSMRALL